MQSQLSRARRHCIEQLTGQRFPALDDAIFHRLKDQLAGLSFLINLSSKLYVSGTSSKLRFLKTIIVLNVN